MGAIVPAKSAAMMAADELAALRAENAALKSELGLQGAERPSRELLYREIARGLLLEDSAVRDVKKFGFEESLIRVDLLVEREPRRLDIPVKKLFTISIVRGYVAEVCNVALPYSQRQWTPYANYLLRAAEQCPGYSRDTETLEWVTAFAQQVCMTHGPAYAQPVSDGAAIYDRIMLARSRRTGLFESSHMGDAFFLRRPDEGISFGQADFVGFVWIHQGYRLTLGELAHRLTSIGFHKEPLSARKGAQVTKMKAVWHSQPGWVRDHDCEMSEPAVPRRRGQQ